TPPPPTTTHPQTHYPNTTLFRSGKIIAKGVLSDILATAPLEISIKLKTTKQANISKNISGINNYIQKLNIISFNYSGDANMLLKQISSLNVNTIEIKKADIEQIFMKYYKD
ncbi:MAG: transporter ATP-binding protein, partial [Patescibacteria group bacterium]|nr:transporter ATP-binding protein [Patescibacteria group bacterium]